MRDQQVAPETELDARMLPRHSSPKQGRDVLGALTVTQADKHQFETQVQAVRPQAPSA
jgi:hypothetical protein